MTGILVLGAIGLVVGLFVWQTNKGGRGDPNARRWGQIGSGVALALMVVGLVGGMFTTVPAGHRGVVIRFSAVTGTVLEEGLQIKLPILDSVVMMSIQTQKYEVPSSAVTKDLQDVSTTIALNWKLDPSMADEVYRTLGTEYISRIAAPPFRRSSSR